MVGDMTTLPDYVTKYFWGDDLSELSWEKHRKYVTKTILNRGDTDAVVWLFKKIDKLEILKNLDTFRLDKRSANFWKIYLS